MLDGENDVTEPMPLYSENGCRRDANPIGIAPNRGAIVLEAQAGEYFFFNRSQVDRLTSDPHIKIPENSDR
jgi:hypothetical protein